MGLIRGVAHSFPEGTVRKRGVYSTQPYKLKNRNMCEKMGKKKGCNDLDTDTTVLPIKKKSYGFIICEGTVLPTSSLKSVSYPSCFDDTNQL